MTRPNVPAITPQYHPDNAAVGLPAPIRGCLFDLDGVLTRTATVHAAAWQEMFDAYLRVRALRTGDTLLEFDPVGDYQTYVDGKSRADGTRAFLASRGIEIPEGSAADPPGGETVHGLADRKNQILLDRIRRDGVQPFPGSVRYVQAARDAGLLRAVVSSSANCADILAAAGIQGLFQARVDAVTAARDLLAGKPAPDMFLAAARVLQVDPGEAAVFEDSLAGVAAGRAGGFGYVVGVDRLGQADQLLASGAEVVVSDLADLLPAR